MAELVSHELSVPAPAVERDAGRARLAWPGYLLAFVASWNGYLLPLLVISTGSLPQELWPLPLGVTQFSSQYSQNTGAILAYTSLAMIPALGMPLFEWN